VKCGEIAGDFVNRLTGEDELALGLRDHTLANQVTRGAPNSSLDVILEPIARHASCWA
jgi:hypothetical protein